MKLDRKYIILFTVCLSTFMSTIDSSIVNISLPVMAKELKVDISSIQWVVSSYLMTITAFLLIWGKLSDVYSRKKLFIGGFMVFTVGSLLCALSRNLEMLVMGRVVQALGASITMALVQGIVTLVFPGNERGKALGVISTAVAMGSLTGPSVGGVLVHLWGWQSIFSINLPIGILGIVMAFKFLPETFENQLLGASQGVTRAVETSIQRTSFDYLGSSIFIGMILLLFMALLGYQDGVVSAMPMWIMLAFASALFIGFIKREKNCKNPMLNLEIFNIGEFSSGVMAAYISFLALFAYMLLMPFYLQSVQGYDILKAGLLMSLYPMALALFAPIFGRLSDRISYKPLTVGGLTLNGFALTWLAFSKEGQSIWTLGLMILLLGTGSAMFQSPNTNSIMGAVPRTFVGIAGSINAFFRNFGMVTGTTLAVLLFGFATRQGVGVVSLQNLEPEVFLKGFRTVMLASAGLSFVGVGLSARRGRTNVER